MSSVALKIKRLVGSTWIETDFYDYEVGKVEITSRKKSILKTLGTGRPKQVIRNQNRIISVPFRIYTTNDSATSTLSKLKDVEAYEANGAKLHIYPKYIDDPSLEFVVIMPKGQGLDQIAVAGRHGGGSGLTVEFLEVESAGGVIDVGDLV